MVTMPWWILLLIALGVAVGYAGFKSVQLTRKKSAIADALKSVPQDRAPLLYNLALNQIAHAMWRGEDDYPWIEICVELSTIFNTSRDTERMLRGRTFIRMALTKLAVSQKFPAGDLNGLNGMLEALSSYKTQLNSAPISDKEHDWALMTLHRLAATYIRA